MSFLNKYNILVLGMALFCSTAISCGLPYPHQSDQIVERWSVSTNKYVVRVTAYAEKGAYVNGTYYIVETALKYTNTWKKIANIRLDDRPQIPASNLQTINDDIGYFYLWSVYAVTTDGGQEWGIWTGRNNVNNDCQKDNFLIDNVNIDSSGNGKMIIICKDDSHRTFITTNYGKTWQPE